MKAGIVVVGDGADDLAGDVEDVVAEPRPVVDDAPPISVDVDVVAGADRRRSSRTARRMLRESRNLRPTPSACMTMTAFCRSPWAIADGIYRGLIDEDDRRDVYLDEIRRALAALDVDRLLPDVARSARDGLAALLAADRPISQAELARRAGISSQSWRNHRDDLAAAGLVEDVEDGWRCCLPFKSERYDDVDGSLPWYLRPEDDVALGNWETRRVSDVLWWLLLDAALLEDTGRINDESDPVATAFATIDVDGHQVSRVDVDDDLLDDVLSEWSVPASIVRAGCSTPPPTTSAVMGQRTQQIQLT